MSTTALGRLAGRWITDGHLADDSTARIRGTDTYVQLPGDNCLIHYVDVVVAETPVRAIELIMSTADQRGFTARAYEDTGAVTQMEVNALADGNWRFTGGGDIATAAQPGAANPGGAVRSTLAVADARMKALWERNDDGAWRPWMVVDFTLNDPVNEQDAFAGGPWASGPAATASEELRSLAPMAGRWRWTGRSVASDFAVDGTTELRWLAGGRVLVERGSLTSAGLTNDSIAATRWDAEAGACVADYVDSDGNRGRYRMSLDGGRLVISWPDFRFHGTVEQDGRIAGTWEQRDDAGTWSYWYDATMTALT